MINSNVCYLRIPAGVDLRRSLQYAYRQHPQLVGSTDSRAGSEALGSDSAPAYGVTGPATSVLQLYTDEVAQM
jgi:hypothetical protein